MSIWSHIVVFFNSDFFIALVTLIAASIAFGLYRKQKNDEKRDAANTILLEIEGAERQLTKVSEDKPFPNIDEEDVYLMRASSWDEFKYLFVNNFDRNEWDKITDFYRRCHDYDEAVTYHNLNSKKNLQALRVNMQRVLANYADEYTRSIEGKTEEEFTELEIKYINRRQTFINIYGNTSTTHMYSYIPIKPQNDAKRALKGLETSLSLTSVGIKLKQLSQKHEPYVKFKLNSRNKKTLQP
jgi:hypothetical protein